MGTIRPMPFPRRFLHDNEEIILDRSPHVWFLAKPFAATIGAFVIWAISADKINPDNRVNGWITWLGFALFVVAAGWMGITYMKWVTTNFVLTTDRLIYRSGAISKHGKEIPLQRVNDITFHQTIFERMIGAGDLMIESGGEQGQERFSDVSRPVDVQNEIYRQMERTQARDMDRMAGRRELSVPEQIEKLNDLREKGVLNQAEFDAKKAQLLEKM